MPNKALNMKLKGNCAGPRLYWEEGKRNTGKKLRSMGSWRETEKLRC
jgi:hypothetical protein